MKKTTLLYHGLSAVLRNGNWVIVSASFNELARIPETDIDKEEVFNELNERGFFKFERITPNIFQLTLITTSDCNLCCRYCFSNSGDFATVMSKDLAITAVDHALLKSKGKRLSIAFFGGEPSLTSDLIREVVEHAKRKKSDSGVNGVEFSITTNGVMTDDFLSFLIDNDFMITLSVDGPADIQDFQRPLKNGRKSSVRVEKTIKRLALANKRFKARVTITENSVNYMTEIVEWFHSLGGREIHFEPVTITGRASIKTKGVSLEKPSSVSFSENLKKAIRAGTRLGVGIINSSFMNIMNPPPEFCEGNSNNRISVSYTGDVTTCVEVQERCHPASDQFIIGHYDQISNKLIIEREAREKTCSGIKMGQCKQCFALRICGGGCPVRNFHVTGQINEVDPYRCELIKVMLPFVFGLFDEAAEGS